MGAEDQAPSAAEAVEAELSEAQIAVHWREEEYYPPPEDVRRAGERERSGDPRALHQRSTTRTALSSTRRCSPGTRSGTQILDTSNPPFWKWWVGGRLNACVNCVDRHLESRGNENALIWVPELEDEETQ